MEIFGYTNDMVGSSKIQLKTTKPGMNSSAQIFKSITKNQKQSFQTLSTPTYSIILLTKIFKQQLK